MEEIYKSIDGFENYEVSNIGNIRNKKTGRILKGRISSTGYYQVDLYKNGKETFKYVHRLVGQAFLENSEDKPYIDHVDGNKLNNNIENLRWCSQKENCQNQKISSKNTSGIKGVCFDKHANKWKAQIMIDGIQINLGLFDNIEEAKEIRVKRANEVFGVFTHSSEKMQEPIVPRIHLPFL